MKNFNSGNTFQDNATFPFSNSVFSKFEKFNFTGNEAKTFEFFFFSQITEEVFTEFKNFFSKEVFPKTEKNSFLKVNFFNDKNFDFNRFNEFFNPFSREMFFELSFFNFPNDFNFSDFGLPFSFNGDFMFSFSIRRTSNR